MPAAKPQPGTLSHPLDLGELLGSTWSGYRLAPGRHDSAIPYQGEFQHDCWRRAFTAGELRALFWQCQRVSGLERETARLAAETEAAERARQEAEKCAAWYRRQLILESRFGAMLARIMEDSE